MSAIQNENKDLRPVFSNNLRGLLAANHMSQIDLARELSIGTSTVNDWVHGKTLPRTPQMQKIVKLFSCSQSELLEEHRDVYELRDNMVAMFAREGFTVKPVNTSVLNNLPDSEPNQETYNVADVPNGRMAQYSSSELLDFSASMDKFRDDFIKRSYPLEQMERMNNLHPAKIGDQFPTAGILVGGAAAGSVIGSPISVAAGAAITTFSSRLQGIIKTFSADKSSDNDISDLSMPTQSKLPAHSLDSDYLFVCPDDSMKEAKIQNGDIVFIWKQEAIESGMIVLAQIAGTTDPILRRYHRTQSGILLLADNPKVQPLFFDSTDEGKVVILGQAKYVLCVIK